MNVTTGRERKLPPFVLGLAGGFALASTVAGTLRVPVATAAPRPDAVALERLRAAAAADNRYRIVTDRAEFVVGALRADENGVALTVPQGRPALIVPPGATTSGRIASWDEMERIEGMRTHGARDLVIGTVIGTAIGFGLQQAIEPGLHDATVLSIVLIPFGAAVGGGIGLLIGNTTGWHGLYP